MMKILLALTVLVGLTMAASMVDVSGFKTAQELQSDILSDKKNIYVLMFVERDESNYELTKNNKKYLDQARKICNDLAP